MVKNTISRQDCNRTHGWLVRLVWFNRKPLVQKSFPDSRYGGTSNSKEAARLFVEEHHANYKPLLRDNQTVSASYATPEERLAIRKRSKKVTVYVGTGRAGVEAARALGASVATLSKILNCKQSTYEPLRGIAAYQVTGFVNQITPELYKQMLAIAIRRADRRLSDECVSDAVSNAMLHYAADVNIENKTDGYIEALIGKCLATMLKRQLARTKSRLSYGLVDTNQKQHIFEDVIS